MSLHPHQVNWFEAEVPRDQSVYALETLAGTGTVQLEEQGYGESPCINRKKLAAQLSQIDKLLQRYASDLPDSDIRPSKHLADPEQLAATIVATLRAWAGQLLNTRRRLRQTKVAGDKLRLLRECLNAAGENAQGLNGLGHNSSLLYKHIFACPRGHIGEASHDESIFEAVYRGEQHDFWVIVSMMDRHAVLDGAATLLECTAVTIPDWLDTDPSDQQRQLTRHQEQLDQQHAELNSKLSALHTDPAVANCLAETRLLRWYLSRFIEQSANQQACHIAGWTVVANPDELEHHLRGAGIQANVAFTPPRSELKAPVSLDAGHWNQPFSLFVRLLGTPDRYEIDPTPFLAIIVPLLFGFMFPDLGHGLVLAAVGALLARRNKAALILVPCGLMAASFGLIFGEVFGMQGIIPSLCSCPLEQPLQILITTLLLGMVVILLGLVFSGIEAWWRGEFRSWLLEQAPVIGLYLSCALIPVFPQAWVFSSLSLLWYILGTAKLCRHSGSACFIGSLGRLLESSFQLAAATLSFMRVGAFALAHGAFSIVVLELVEQIDTAALQVAVFILGHLFIIIVEGLIVMIQTTRLVLFEFFSRFLRFEGRIYQPLEKPPMKNGTQ